MNRLAAWNFDEASGDVLDASGNGHNFSLSSPATRTMGKFGTALTQSSVSTFLLSSTILSALKTPNRTIAAWVKETAPTIGWVSEFNVSSIDSGSWGILFLSSQWHIQARNADGYVRCSIARPTDSLFHHVAGTYDGTNVRMYLDGSLVSTQSLAGPIRSDADIFRLFDNTGSTIVVDDLQYFDTALSVSEIADTMSPVIAGRSGKPKVWNGSTWAQHQAKAWNGSTWVNVKMAGYDGTDWITAK